MAIRVCLRLLPCAPALLLAWGVLAAPLADRARTLPLEAKPVLDDRYPQRRVSFPDGVVGLADVTYEQLQGFRPLILDLYLPPGSSGQRPLVLYVHGGGWLSGHTRQSGAFGNWPGVLASLAARGYVVASVEYRLSGEARFPAAIHDVKAAIRWLRAHASTYGIDRSRAVIWGGSAGGQLAALAGTSCAVAALEPPVAGAASSTPAPSVESDCVQGFIAWYGIFDFATLTTQSAANGAHNVGGAQSAGSLYLGCALESCAADVLAAASPASYADPSDPAALLIYGAGDRTVPPQQSKDFFALLRSKGIQAQLIEIPAVDHSFIGGSLAATRAASLRALQASFDFIDRTIGPRSPGGAAHAVPAAR